MKKLFAFLLLFLLTSTSCTHRQEDISSQKNSTSLKISFHSWIGNGIYLIAQEKGFWKKEGIQVELQQVDDNAISKQLLSSKSVDGIMGWTPETIQILADMKVPMKVLFATDISNGADGIIATKDIKTLQDLKGRSISFENASPSHLFLSYLLEEQGLLLKDMNVIHQTASDAGASFVAGKVDAAVTWEPWLSKASTREGGHILISSKNTPYLPAIPAFRTEVLSERPEDIRAFMKGIFAAIDYTRTNPEESYSIIAKGYHLTDEEVREQIPSFKWLSYQESLAYTTAQKDSLSSTLETAGVLWKKLGLISKATPAKEILDSSFLENLYK